MKVPIRYLNNSILRCGPSLVVDRPDGPVAVILQPKNRQSKTRSWLLSRKTENFLQNRFLYKLFSVTHVVYKNISYVLLLRFFESDCKILLFLLCVILSKFHVHTWCCYEVAGKVSVGFVGFLRIWFRDMSLKKPLKKIVQQKIILASASPRRKDLLEQMGLAVEIYPADLDESRFQEKKPEGLARILSLEKALAIAREYPDTWVLGADTIVVVENTVLGKPSSRQEAMDMLHRLSGVEHSVFTGFSLIRMPKNGGIDSGKETILQTRCVETKVRFKPLSEDAVSWYADTDEPYDKAGGYGIQGKAAWMIESIKGSYTNVMGLPLGEVSDLLLELGVIAFRS